jgi:hypothetical protein
MLLFAAFDFLHVPVPLKPAFIFDGRNILDHAKLRDIGFQLFAVGKPDHSNL